MRRTFFYLNILLLLALIANLYFCNPSMSLAAQSTSSLQSLLDNMTSGSTLNLPTGEYTGTLSISKSGVLNFDGVTIYGTVTNTANNITINDLVIRHAKNYAGFNQRGNNVVVNNMSIWDTDENTGSGADADGMRVRGDNVVFNNLYINLEGGSKQNAHADCVQFETWVGPASNIVFNGGVCINRWIDSNGNVRESTGFMIQKESASWTRVTVRNFLVVAFRGINSNGGSFLTVEHNTFVASGNYGELDALQSHKALGFYSGGNTNGVFTNNIILNYVAPVIVTGVSLTGSKNIIYCGVSCTSDSGWSHTDQLWNVNPMLNSNFKPASNSPACSGGYGGTYIGAFACESTPTYPTGDFNHDGVVNIQDFVVFSSKFGTSDSTVDLNSDGIVNIQDFVIFSSHFGETG
jgi:hypothetical protein